MIDLINISDNFNKNKKLILQVLIDHYGQEYSEIIKSKIENVFFDVV